MTLYYTTWYKTGVPPAITQDKFYTYHRPTPKATLALNDSLPAPVQWNVTDDKIYTTTFITPNSPVSYISVMTGGSWTSYAAQPGVNRYAQPFGMGAVNVSFLDAQNNTLVMAQSNVQIQNWTMVRVRPGWIDVDRPTITTTTSSRAVYRRSLSRRAAQPAQRNVQSSIARVRAACAVRCRGRAAWRPQ